jgi:hypothetical protein
LGKTNALQNKISGFQQLTDETFTEAWEHYHGLMIDLPTIRMEDWEFTEGFYCGLSEEAKDQTEEA